MSTRLVQVVTRFCVLYFLYMSNLPVASCEPILWKKSTVASLIRLLFLHVSNLLIVLDLSPCLTQVVSQFCGRKLLCYLLVGSFIFLTNYSTKSSANCCCSIQHVFWISLAINCSS